MDAGGPVQGLHMSGSSEGLERHAVGFGSMCFQRLVDAQECLVAGECSLHRVHGIACRFETAFCRWNRTL